MGNRRVLPEKLGEVIGEELQLYTTDVENKLFEAGKKAIKALERITKASAPFNPGAGHKHFRDAIASKSERLGMGVIRNTWYVKPPHHRLTHLLVHGHEKKDGGRTKADPFLQNALDQVLPQYEKDVEEALKGV